MTEDRSAAPPLPTAQGAPFVWAQQGDDMRSTVVRVVGYGPGHHRAEFRGWPPTTVENRTWDGNEAAIRLPWLAQRILMRIHGIDTAWIEVQRPEGPLGG